MTRDEIDSLVADVFAEHFARLQADLEACIERTLAAKPIPPFVPPPPWVAGKWGAGLMARHRGGLFYARRDTAGEPGLDDAWLPMVNGFVGCTVRWQDDRTLVFTAETSDGATSETLQRFAVPISRGGWNAAHTYQPGDRAERGLEYEAIAESQGIDPEAPGASAFWRRVATRAMPTFRVADNGDMFAAGERIGTIRPLMQQLVNDIVARYRAEDA